MGRDDARLILNPVVLRRRSDDDFRSTLLNEERLGANPEIEDMLRPPDGPTPADEQEAA